MKRVTLALVFCFSLGCVNVVYADVWGRLAHTVGKAWEDTKRETTKAAHNTEKTIGKAWEDTKRETTKALKNITISGKADYRKEINGDGSVNTEIKVNL